MPGDSTILLLPAAGTITGAESIPLVQGGVTKVETLSVILAPTEKLINKGVAGGYPSLDLSGLVPASQLPSYIDDVLEGTWVSTTVFNNDATSPSPYVPAKGIIYVDTTTNLSYRWSGSVYVKINDGSVTSFNSRVGAILPVAGDYTKADVGLSNVDNTSDAAKPVSTAQAVAIATKEPAIAAGTLQDLWIGNKSWSNARALIYGQLVPAGYAKTPGTLLNGISLQTALQYLDGNIDILNLKLQLDAAAFIAVTGITDPTQISALNQLVSDLHYYKLWDKLIAIYPMIGGTATTHKYNLKDPRDLDLAHRLVFSGGLTHSSTGCLPNGTTGYADTKFCMTLEGLHSYGSYGFYSRTNIGASGTRCDIGVANGSTSESSLFINDSGYTVQAFSDYTFPYLAIADTRGMFILSKGYDYKVVTRNGSVIMNNSTTIVPNYSIFNVTLFAKNNNGTISQYSNKECAFAFIGKPLTSDDKTNLQTLIQAFQTTLSRQV